MSRTLQKESPPGEARRPSGETEAREAGLSASRPEMIVAGLILLLNAYRCRGCPHVAGCIVSHCRTLRAHPAADPVLRQLAAHLEREWCPLAQAPGSARRH